ncbi:class I SAM-dependent methyltransferase [Negadavirga shengliensis]|uniref:Class I SAM-dependent methyltransferase n=1 Tax=Negadavirga shengliensis TaxID=1389218 RepID=A0ABV9SXT3_9BACT
MDEFVCNVCQHKIAGEIVEVKEMMFGTGEAFQYGQCGNCGTIQLLNPPPDIEYYYPDEYYAFSDLSFSNPHVNWLKTLRIKLFRFFDIDFFKPVYGDWLKLLDAKVNEKITDIGCGNGQLLYELYASGFRDLTGFDPFIDMDFVINPSLRLYKRGLDDIKGPFDIIMLHHALEHMPDLAHAFRKISQLLSVGGRALVRLPVSDGEAWQIYKQHWVQLDAPRHYFIPSLKAMKLLAEANDLEIYEVVFDSSEFQFWASELYAKGLPFFDTRDKSLFPKEELLKYKRKSLQLNKEGKGDQACFYLKKK